MSPVMLVTPLYLKLGMSLKGYNHVNTDRYEKELQVLSLWHSWEQSFTDPILVEEEVE